MIPEELTSIGMKFYSAILVGSRLRAGPFWLLTNQSQIEIFEELLAFAHENYPEEDFDDTNLMLAERKEEEVPAELLAGLIEESLQKVKDWPGAT